jgi:hypothetical protein
VEFSTLGEYAAAITAGRLDRGDVVFVSRSIYEALAEADRDWLWRSALEARVRLVTDVDVEPGIVVRRGWAAGDRGAADAATPP